MLNTIVAGFTSSISFGCVKMMSKIPPTSVFLAGGEVNNNRQPLEAKSRGKVRQAVGCRLSQEQSTLRAKERQADRWLDLGKDDKYGTGGDEAT